MRVVLDTNVLVAALLSETGASRHVVSMVFGGKLKLCLSEDILTEYVAVLRRPKFDFPPRLVADFLKELCKDAAFSEPTVRHDCLADPKDNRFIDVAVSAQADIVITLDKKHFNMPRFKNASIVSPGELLNSLREET